MNLAFYSHSSVGLKSRVVVSRSSSQRLLSWVSGCALAWLPAAGQSVAISDLNEDPITATVTDSLNPGDNRTITAEKTTPEKVTFSISVDGRGGGSGVAVMFDADGKTVSDILEVSVTQKFRGARMDIPYLSISGTFTSDADPGGLDISSLNLTEAIRDKVLKAGVKENGSSQDLGSKLIDTSSGDALAIGGLTLTAASDLDVPEPRSVLAGAILLGVWGFFRQFHKA